MDAFRELVSTVGRTDTQWRAWYDAEAPERLAVPTYQDRLSKFERMCIVKVGPTSKCYNRETRQDLGLLYGHSSIGSLLNVGLTSNPPKGQR